MLRNCENWDSDINQKDVIDLYHLHANISKVCLFSIDIPLLNPGKMQYLTYMKILVYKIKLSNKNKPFSHLSKFNQKHPTWFLLSTIPKVLSIFLIHKYFFFLISFFVCTPRCIHPQKLLSKKWVCYLSAIYATSHRHCSITFLLIRLFSVSRIQVTETRG